MASEQQPSESYDGGYEHQPTTTPGIGDLLVTNTNQTADTVDKLITTSDDAAQFIPRAIVTPQERKRFVRMAIAERFVESGEMSAKDQTWLDLAYSIAQGGRGRRQAENIAIGRRDSLFPQGRGRNRFQQEDKTL